MSDATRDEAIQWCIDKGVHLDPAFAPPEGWLWCYPKRAGMAYKLIPKSTHTESRDIDYRDLSKERLKIFEGTKYE